MDGIPVGKEIGRYYLRNEIESTTGPEDKADGSIMMVAATDAPLRAHELERFARRVMLGLGRTGSPSTNGSGDFVIAFSTAGELRSPSDSDSRLESGGVLRNDALSPLFQAVVEATEEAIYNSLPQGHHGDGTKRYHRRGPFHRKAAGNWKEVQPAPSARLRWKSLDSQHWICCCDNMERAAVEKGPLNRPASKRRRSEI